MKPKSISVQRQSLLMHAIFLALALWSIAAMIYVSMQLQRDLKQPLRGVHAALAVHNEIETTLDKLLDEAERAALRPAQGPSPQFRQAADRLTSLSFQYPILHLPPEKNRWGDVIRRLSSQLTADIEELYKVQRPTPQADALLREVQVLRTQIDFVHQSLNQSQIGRLEATASRLKGHTRTFYLLLTTSGLFAILALRLFQQAQRRQLWAPLEDLRRMVSTIRRGNLDVTGQIPASVELGTLVEAFLEMAAELREMRNSLEQKVQERTAKLEATQKQLLQAEKLSAIGQMVSGVAHAINNPLAAILGFCEILLTRGDLTPQGQANLQVIRNESLRLRTLVANLHSFARRGVQRTSRLDLRHVLDRIAELRRYELSTNKIELHYARPAEPVWVLGDIDLLLQVVFNLVLNAEQALVARGQGGQIRLECKAEASQAGFTVRDTGGGMSAAMLDRIFEPFYTTKPVGQGTGLGLSISHGIIQQHRGEIVAESAEGCGTTIRVSLPLAEPDSTPAAEPPGEIRVRQAVAVTRHVLVIDDEPAISALIEQAVEKQGWRITILNDPTAVEDALASADLDLVICDLKMPGRNGLEVLQLLRQKRPALA